MADPRTDPAEPANTLMRLTCNNELPWRARLLCAGALCIEILPDDLWRGIVLDDGEGWRLPIEPGMLAAAMGHAPDDDDEPEADREIPEVHPSHLQTFREVDEALAKPEPESFTCPRCNATSFHPDDIANGYCGRCEAFTREDRAACEHRNTYRDLARAANVCADCGEVFDARGRLS